MALTTLQGVLDGLRPAEPLLKGVINNSSTLPPFGHSSWFDGGWPSAGVLTTPGLSGATLTYPVTGAIRLDDPGANETVVASLTAVSRLLVAGAFQGILLVDRLWDNSGLVVTSTTAQTINSVTWPSRDKKQSTQGEGVYIGLEVALQAGAAAPTLTMSYTNSAGVSGRTATNIIATGNSPGPGRLYIIGLQAGDIGVQSIQSFTLSASWVSGTIRLMAFRPILLIPIVPGLNSPINVQSTVADALSLAAPRIWSGSVLHMIYVTTSGQSNPGVTGSIQLSQG